MDDLDAYFERLAIQNEIDQKEQQNYVDARKKLGAVNLSTLDPECVSWLWEPRIALGKVTIIEGDPGLGKSTMALALGTAITLGARLPASEPREPGMVLLISVEDGIKDTVIPRLIKLGANRSRVEAIEKRFTMDRQGATLLHHFMAGLKPTVVIIDPLFAFLGPKMDVNKQSDARSVMDMLGRLAAHHGAAIVAIRHLNKGRGDKSIYRGGGSIDFTAAARSVLLVGADPQDRRNRAVVHIKNNLGPLADSIGFSLDRGEFAWTGQSQITADQILGNETEASEDAAALQDAVRVLKEILKPGPLRQDDVMRQGKLAGIQKHLLNKARRQLGVRSTKDGADWDWALPNA